MGMFDYVNFKMPCPKCGTMVQSFQTKDGRCLMDRLEPDNVSNFYDVCPNAECRVWIEFDRSSRDVIPLRNPPLTKEEVEARGFVMKV